MTSKIAESFMHTLQQIEETKDVEPLAAMFTEDAELSNLAMVEPLQGRDGARRFWNKYLSVFDQIHSEFTHVVETDAAVTMEWISQGSLTTGEPIKYRGISVIETDNGQVRSFRTYYDSAAFLPQSAKKE